MSDEAIDPKVKANLHLEKAEGYKKLGLAAQVQHEIAEAVRLDAGIINSARYHALQTKIVAEEKQKLSLRSPLRIGALMLFVNAGIGGFFLLFLLATGEGSTLSTGDFLNPIVSVIFGVNLWQGKDDWQRYTVWWAAIGLIFFGGGALLIGDWFSVIIQAAYSGSLIILLAGTPTKGRTTTAVVIYVVGYIGILFAFIAFSFLAGFFEAV